MTVEITWDGKYDADGEKRSPLRIALPFQTVETINESVQERQRSLEKMFSREDGQGEWRNRLIWGDKKYVLPSLLEEFAGKVNLIYIDPPFDTGANFTFEVEIEDKEFTKEPSVIEQKAYRDIWSHGLDSYLQWFYETVILLRELLADSGSMYVHIGSDISNYVKAVMDEVFGAENSVNSLTWFYRNKLQFGFAKNFPRDTETIFLYSKSPRKHTFHHQYIPLDKPRKQNRITWDPIAKKTVTVKDDKGKVVYYESKERMVGSMWEIPRVNSMANEDTNYPTQKPEALLERIIKASSNEGDLVLDCFCGSGTTAAVAEKLNRRWITCDLGRFAIHTARKRILRITNVKPFVVQNLGKYERQVWQEHQFGADAQTRIDAYTDFILKLYHAQPLNGFTWLHGVKSGRGVHVGSVDSPVTMADVKSIVIEWKKNLGTTKQVTNTGIDILGWEFALELHETARQQAAEAGVDLRFLTIPREVLEQKAVDQGDIQFYELAALFVNHEVSKRKLTLELTNFIAPLEYVPQEVREKITKWQSWIDYWAVDWDFKGDTFHNQWQSYRTRKDKTITTIKDYTYESAGEYLVQVKVMDILGNDTTRTLKIKIS